MHHQHDQHLAHQSNAPAAKPGETRWLTVALIAVTAFLGIQTVQLVSLRRSLAAEPAASAVLPSGAAAPTAAPLPSSLQNLPNMVGGC